MSFHHCQSSVLTVAITVSLSKGPQGGPQRSLVERSKSPIETQRTGFTKVNQVLADSLLRQFPSDRERKLVLFSDSRQDAAKLSAGVELSHYLDTIRQVAGKNPAPVRKGYSGLH